MQAQQCAATLGLSIAALTKQASGQENSIMVVVQVFPLLLGGRELLSARFLSQVSLSLWPSSSFVNAECR